MPTTKRKGSTGGGFVRWHFLFCLVISIKERMVKQIMKCCDNCRYMQIVIYQKGVCGPRKGNCRLHGLELDDLKGTCTKWEQKVSKKGE
jgi:hypothetical protein